MRRYKSIGHAEFEILAYIAANPGLTVTEVHKHFEKEAGMTRGTVLKTMERLRAKGHLDRKDIDKFWRYHSVKPLMELQEGVVEDVINHALSGADSKHSCTRATSG